MVPLAGSAACCRPGRWSQLSYSLPTDTIVLAVAPAIGDTDKIHEMLTWLQTLHNACKFRVFIANHHGLCMIQHCVDSIHHQPRDVWNTVEDEVAVCANQAGHVHVLVEDAQVVALSDQVLDNLNHRTLAQIVRACLEAESQNTNLPLSLIGYQPQSLGHLQFV